MVARGPTVFLPFASNAAVVPPFRQHAPVYRECTKHACITGFSLPYQGDLERPRGVRRSGERAPSGSAKGSVMSIRFRPPHRTPRTPGTPSPGGFTAILTLTILVLAGRRDLPGGRGRAAGDRRGAGRAGRGTAGHPADHQGDPGGVTMATSFYAALSSPARQAFADAGVLGSSPPSRSSSPRVHRSARSASS